MPITIDITNTINDDCEGWWPMDDGSGTTARDISGNGNDGTLNGGVGWGTGPTGSGGATTYTNSGSEGITVTHDATLAIVGDMTVCAWVKMPSFPSFHGALQKGTSYPNPYGLVIGTSAEQYLTSGDGGSQDYALSTNPVPTDTWCCIAGVRSGTDLTLYLDGSANGTTTIGVTPSDAAGDLVLGNRTDYATPFYGSLASVRVWSRALSGAEISALYADPYEGQYVEPTADPPTPATAPLSSDRLYNRTLTRIFRRGETG